MGLSILTYNGKVQFGLITDARLVPDPDVIIEQFGDEFEKLVMMTLMGPYGPEYADELERAFGDQRSAPADAKKKKLKRAGK